MFLDRGQASQQVELLEDEAERGAADRCELSLTQRTELVSVHDYLPARGPLKCPGDRQHRRLA